MTKPWNRRGYWLLTLAFAAAPGCRRTDAEGQRLLASAARPEGSAAASAEPTEPLALAKRWCAALHRLPAERKSACCGRPTEAPLLDECERVTLAALQSRAIALDGQALADCEQAMRGALEGCDWVTPGHPQGPRACERALVGTRRAGQTCRSSLECHAPLHCAMLTPGGAGVCEPPAELGASCGVATDALAAYTVSRGLEIEHPLCKDFCALTSHQCEPLPASGAACRASVNCRPGQRCSDGYCVDRASVHPGDALAKSGAACESDFDCERGGCVATADGVRRCGMKCTASFDARSSAGAPRLALPLRPRGTAN